MRSCQAPPFLKFGWRFNPHPHPLHPQQKRGDAYYVIDMTDQGSYDGFVNGSNYLMEANKQLGDTDIYQSVINYENVLSRFLHTNNKIFISLKKKETTKRHVLLSGITKILSL